MLLMATAPLYAQTEGGVQEDSLQEVTVYAQANRRGEMVPTQRLGGEQLRRMGAMSVADAVRYFSGVQLKDYGGVGGLKTLDLRAMGSSHMAVFYDGVQLGNAQNGQIDLGRFSMDNIEEIALYNGQKSDLMQSAKDFGASGTLYLRTRRPQFCEGKNWNLRATLRTGAFGLYNPSLTWEQQWSTRLCSSLSIDHTAATGEYKFRYHRVTPSGAVAYDTTATRHNGDIHAHRIEGTLFGSGRRSLLWDSKVYYYQSQRGIPGAIVNNVWMHHQRQWDRNLFVQGSIKQYPTAHYQYQVQWKYAHDWLRYQSNDPKLMYVDNRFTQDELYLSTSHLFTPGRGWQLSLSSDYQLNALHANLLNFIRPLRHTMMWAAAVRYQPSTLSLMGTLMGTHVTDNRRSTAHATNRYNRLTPALFASYRLTPSLTLRAFGKQTFRMPTLNDLYYTDVGSSILRPERTTQLNIGPLWTKRYHRTWLRQIELKGDAYVNWVNDKIVAIPKGSGQYRWMMMNIGRVRILGSELSAQTILQPSPDITLSMRGNYTWQRAQDRSDRSDPLTYNRQIAYIPKHSFSIIATLAWRDVTLNYSFIYVGERYHNSANIPANYEQPWYTNDISLSYSPQLHRGRPTLQLEINNLMNQQYDVVPNYPMPGRNCRLTMKLEL